METMKKGVKVGGSHTYDMEKLYARLLVVSQHGYIHLSDLWEGNAGQLCCDGTIQKADLDEDLVVGGETYGSVKRVSYLGDTLDGDGGCLLCQK